MKPQLAFPKTEQEKSDYVQAVTQWPTSDYYKALIDRHESARSWKVHLSAVLTRDLRQLVLALLKAVDRRKHALSARVALGSVIKIPNESRGLRREVVDIVILDEESRKPTFLIFRHRPRREVSETLGWKRVPYVSLDDLKINTPAEAAAQIIDRLQTAEPPSMVKPLGFQQRLLRQQIRDALWLRTDHDGGDLPPNDMNLAAESWGHHLEYMESNSWLVLEEVALNAVIQPGQKICSAVDGFVKTSSIDILVTLSTANGSSYPLLAVEFDGDNFHGDYPAQIRDMLKSQLLADASIPLIRVREKEANMTRWLKKPSDDYDRMMGHIKPLKRIARLIVNQQAREWRAVHLHAQETIAFVELAQTMFGKSSADLSDEELSELFRSVEYLEISQEGDIERHFDQQQNEEVRAEAADFALFLKSRQLDPHRGDNFTVKRVGPTEWSGHFTLIKTDGSRQEIELSQISIRATGLSDQHLDDAVGWYLREEAAEIIRDLTDASCF